MPTYTIGAGTRSIQLLGTDGGHPDLANATDALGTDWGGNLPGCDCFSDFLNTPYVYDSNESYVGCLGVPMFERQINSGEFTSGVPDASILNSPYRWQEPILFEFFPSGPIILMGQIWL
ncbi:MAG TPA: hypothetical protein VEP90_22140 [Methylomirabilota bacterium]|nr:hypothetical protein [Methylomirabilota bacterium]